MVCYWALVETQGYQVTVQPELSIMDWVSCDSQAVNLGVTAAVCQQMGSGTRVISAEQALKAPENYRKKWPRCLRTYKNFSVIICGPTFGHFTL